MRTLLLTLIGAACTVLSLTWSAPAWAGADERARVLDSEARPLAEDRTGR